MNFKFLKNNSSSKVPKKVHFIGLGGIGMSALAFILRDTSIAVQGSDISENYITPKLRQKGVEYFVGHKKENITDEVSLVIKTSIIKDDNPELIAAQEKNIPVITRANLLAQIMAEKKGITIAGTHGKTSTTAITATILDIAGLDPTVINGGVINYFGSNSKSGKGEYLVAESDESDASFVELPSFIGAITNIEPEHLEFKGYGGCFEVQKSYFEKYVSQIPEDGICAICIDDKEAENLYNKLIGSKKNLVSYSINKNGDKNADLVAQNIKISPKGLTYDVYFKNGRTIKDVTMPAYGFHNVSNSLASIAIADFLQITDEKIKQALEIFDGVKRRFTKVGQYNGAVIIDDYAHHPTEIKAVLQAARNLAGKGKIYAIFQPHKYSRLKDLFDGFCGSFSDANHVIVADIYSTGQALIPGASQDDLVKGIIESGKENVTKLNSENDLAPLLKDKVKDGDIIICLGAGSITYWAGQLEEQLKTCD